LRVLHIGDSHTGSDVQRQLLRATLEARYGAGGSGIVFPWLSRGGLRAGASTGWRRYEMAANRLAPAPVVGLRGVALEADRAGERAWFEATFSRIRLHLLTQPGGGKAALRIDGLDVGSIDLESPSEGVRLLRWGASGSPTRHVVEISTQTAGRVRLLGATLEGGAGASYSPLWLNGAQAGWLLRLPEAVLTGLLQAESPDAIVLAFGTNEACDRTFDPAVYEESLSRLLMLVRTAAPRAAVLLVAPPDAASARVDARNLALITEVQRRLADSFGAGFVDLQAEMGGPGSIRSWMQNGLARRDAVHFTSEGYSRLGQSVAARLLASLGAPAASLGLAYGAPRALQPERRAVARASVASRASGGSSSGIYLFRTTDGLFIMTDDPSRIAGRAGEWVGPAPR
jgi:lysophospholipase L1-like esterase